jgi:hypothetical protein
VEFYGPSKEPGTRWGDCTLTVGLVGKSSSSGWSGDPGRFKRFRSGERAPSRGTARCAKNASRGRIVVEYYRLSKEASSGWWSRALTFGLVEGSFCGACSA